MLNTSQLYIISFVLCICVFNIALSQLDVPQHSLGSNLLQWPRGKMAKTVTGRVHAICDVSAANGICLRRGEQAITPDGVAAHTIMQFNFDQNFHHNKIIDQSGHANHASSYPLGTTLLTGPDRIASGSSARFTGSSYLRTSPSKTIPANSITASFWINLVSPAIKAGSNGCVAFGWGKTMIGILPSHHLSFIAEDADPVVTKSKVKINHWTHVAIVMKENSAEYAVYINGILDQHIKGLFKFTPNTLLYIGGHPKSECLSADFLIDDIKVYSKALDEGAIKALSFPSLGGMETDFITLGCSRNNLCDAFEAEKICKSGYHVCNEQELASGAYLSARNQGWVTWDDAIWTAESVTMNGVKVDDRKVVICCAYNNIG